MGIQGLLTGVAQFLLLLSSGKEVGRAALEPEDYVVVEVRGELYVCGEFDCPPLDERIQWLGIGSRPRRSEFAVRDSTHSLTDVEWRLNLGEDADLERTANDLKGQTVIVTGERFLPGYNGYGFARGRIGWSEPGIWVRSIRPVKAVTRGRFSFLYDPYKLVPEDPFSFFDDIYR